MRQRYLIINDQKFIEHNFLQTWTADDLKKGATKKVSKQRIIQIFGRIVLPTTTAAFVLFYISVAAYIYNNPKLNYV